MTNPPFPAPPNTHSGTGHNGDTNGSDTSVSGMERCPCGCGRVPPVEPGGDYPDEWIPTHVEYVPPETADVETETFEDHALSVLAFDASASYTSGCMACGFVWPVHVHEDREDQELDDWDNLVCPHCGSEAVVATEGYDAE